MPLRPEKRERRREKEGQREEKRDRERKRGTEREKEGQREKKRDRERKRGTEREQWSNGIKEESTLLQVSRLCSKTFCFVSIAVTQNVLSHDVLSCVKLS